MVWDAGAARCSRESTVKGRDRFNIVALRECHDGRIDEAEPGPLLLAEYAPGLSEDLGTSHKLDLASLKKILPDLDGSRKVLPQKKHRYDFQKNVFQKKCRSPFSIPQPAHGFRSRRMVHVTPVVKGNQETAVEDDHDQRP
jgi:hypothetical protein